MYSHVPLGRGMGTKNTREPKSLFFQLPLALANGIGYKHFPGFSPKLARQAPATKDFKRFFILFGLKPASCFAIYTVG